MCSEELLGGGRDAPEIEGSQRTTLRWSCRPFPGRQPYGLLFGFCVADHIRPHTTVQTVQSEWSRYLLGCGAEQFPHHKSCSVQLRLGVPNRTPEDASDLRVLVAFDFMQQEDGPVTLRKFLDRARQGDAMEGAGEPLVNAPVFTLGDAGVLVTRLIE
jgi:hypothetical protein